MSNKYILAIKYKVKTFYYGLFFLYQKIKHPSSSFGKIIRKKGFIFDVSGSGYKIKFGNVNFRENCMIRVRKSGSLTLENNISFNRGCSINCLNSIRINKNCIFGENVKLYDHDHRFNDEELLISQQGFSLGKIEIGTNCWFGSNVVILKNVTIGDNVVVGANCVISKDIPSDSIVRNTNTIEISPIVSRNHKK